MATGFPLASTLSVDGTIASGSTASDPPVLVAGVDGSGNVRTLSVGNTGVLNVSFSGTVTVTGAVTVTGSVTANAGTNLNTSLLALESGGNLAAIKTDLDTVVTNTNKIPASPATEGGNLATLVTDMGGVTETAPATDTASSGLNGRLQRIAQRITSLIALLPGSLGQKAMTASLAVTVASDQASFPVTIAAGSAVMGHVITDSGSTTVLGANSGVDIGKLTANQTVDLNKVGGTTLALGGTTASASIPVTLASDGTFATLTGAVTETPPATDTASSGLNGRLQRIAQRLTSIIALLPTALGTGGGLKVDGSGTALPISGTVTANAGTNLNTSALALEAGNLATLVTDVGGVTETAPATDTASSGLNGRLQRIAQRITSLIALIPASLGQKTSANSFAVVVASDQSALTITGLSADTQPASPNTITVVDSGSATATGANSQSIITGTATASSACAFALSSVDTVLAQVTGTWTGTLQIEISFDGGTTWFIRGLHQAGTNYTASSFTANFGGGCNVGGCTNVRIRATAAMTGTAVVKVSESQNPNTLYVANTPSLADGTTKSTTATVKAASTPPATTDTNLVVGIANGNDVAKGATTDSAATTFGGTASEIALLKFLIRRAMTLVPAAFTIGTATTNGTGSSYTTLGSAACDYVNFGNNTGTAIEYRHGGAGNTFVIFNGAYLTVPCPTGNANELSIRRVDQSNTTVTMTYQIGTQ